MAGLRTGDDGGMTPPVEPVTREAPGYTGPTMMTQRWCDVAFLHWAVDPAEVAPLLPPGVRPDVRDGVTWVGLVPFRMVGAGVLRGPSIPWLGTFPETNVRLYTVDDRGVRGIVFRSLDATRLAVVAGARAAFGLPYRWATMRIDDGPDRGSVVYETSRPHPSRVRLRVGEPIASGPLEEFLTARWGLHERHLGVDWYVPNVHEPWPLHRAELLELDDTLLARAGFPGLAGRPPDHVAASPGVSVRFGLPAALAAPGDPHRRAYWRSANTATAAAWASTMTAPSTVRRSHAPTTRPRLASTQAELPSTTTQVAGRGITARPARATSPAA